MERIYINRDCCIAYVLLAIHTISNSANKEIRINEFIKEIMTMFELYTDEIALKKKTEEILSKEGNNKIIVLSENDEKLGITIAEAAKLMGISKQLMAKLAKETDFPCVKFQRRVVINKELLPEWFAKHCGDFFIDY